MTGYRKQRGVTLIELLIAVAMGALIVAGMSAVMHELTQTQAAIQEHNRLTEDGRFAMQRMVDAVRSSNRLLIPLSDNPATPFNENLREQTIPASPPPSGSSLATAVLAVTLNRMLDLDGNGIFDADNDGDGRFDEDLPADTENDGMAGVRDFDDDGNGIKDYLLSPAGDDDESDNFAQSEDPFNGIDDDGDGSIDEDPGADNNGDGCPGICGVDDDGDGSVDEGNANDDDEDGLSDEDWYDPLVFYLENGVLKERTPVPWDESGAGGITGRDFIISDIADNVTRLRFERSPPAGGGPQLVDITLELTGPDTGETVSLHTRVRIGGAL